MELIIITGMSGAGKSQVVNALEDIGYFCVDNIPPELIVTFSRLVADSGEHDKTALVTDSRAGKSFDKLFCALDELSELDIPHKLMFIDADDDVLVSRYKETRRRHPLLSDTVFTVEEAVEKERSAIGAARDRADIIFDTTGLSAIQCRVRISEMFSKLNSDTMNVHCVSFGYKYGIPNDADLVFDVRCLPNPFYVPSLKPMTGLDAPVYDYIMEAEESKQFAEKVFDIVDFSLPLYRKEGRSQLIIAFGCTGGHHRSVTFARLMNEHLEGKGYNLSISHRDINK
ncbi:MAG: RNase adapter RapZ [Acutalibacteraceae bacterium]